MEQKKICLFLFFVQGSLSKVSIDFILLAYLHINQKKKEEGDVKHRFGFNG